MNHLFAVLFYVGIFSQPKVPPPDPASQLVLVEEEVRFRPRPAHTLEEEREEEARREERRRIWRMI